MVSHQVFAVYRAAEPFVRVVVRIGHLQVVDFRTAADRTECDAVDFLVGLERITGEFYADVLQFARVVGIVAAAVLRAGAALDLHFVQVVFGFPADDQAAPVARFTRACGLLRGENDGFVGSSGRMDFAAPLDDQRRFGILVAEDDRSGRDGDRRSFGDVDPASEQIFFRGIERYVAFESVLLVAVAQVIGIGQQIARIVLALLGAERRVNLFVATAASAAAVIAAAVFVVAADCQHCQRRHEHERNFFHRFHV